MAFRQAPRYDTRQWRGRSPISSRPKQRHSALDAVRGVAAIGVAHYHFLLYAMGVDVQSMGTFTVYLFFSLSALAMMMVYGGRFAERVEYSGAVDFYRARAARILPLLLLVSLINVALLRSVDAAALGLLTGTGFFALAIPGFTSVASGAWSLAIEFGFYLVFPMLALLLGRLSLRTLVAVSVAVLAVQQLYLAILAPWAATDPGRHWDYYTVPLTFAPFFLIGFAVHRTPAVRSRWAALPAALCMAAIMCFSLLYSTNLLVDPLAYMLLTALVAALMFFAWRTELPKPLVPVARALGEISYSLYLTHWYFFLISKRIAAALGLPAWQWWLLFMASALAGSWLCYRFFERPIRMWARAPRPAGA